MATKKKRSAEETWDAIVKAAEADEMQAILDATPEEIDASLRASGLDPKKVREDGAALAERLLADRARLSWQIEAREGMAKEQARVAAIAGRYAKLGRDELLALLASAKASPRFDQPASFMFRNHAPEEATDEQLRGMLEELDALAEKKT